MEQRNLTVENRFNASKTHKRQETDGKSEKTRAPRNATPVQNDVAIHEDLNLVVHSPDGHVVLASPTDCRKHRPNSGLHPRGSSPL